MRRYRVLFNTLLKGADDLEEGLIQDEKPFAGTRRFGMCWVRHYQETPASCMKHTAVLSTSKHCQH